MQRSCVDPLIVDDLHLGCPYVIVRIPFVIAGRVHGILDKQQRVTYLLTGFPIDKCVIQISLGSDDSTLRARHVVLNLISAKRIIALRESGPTLPSGTGFGINHLCIEIQSEVVSLQLVIFILHACLSE